jgi:hypothetical protein
LFTYSFVGGDDILLYSAELVGDSLYTILKIEQQGQFASLQFLQLLIEWTVVASIAAIKVI